MKALKIDQRDTVATLIEDANVGENVEGVVLRQDVGRGHKVAIVDIPVGTAIVKFGFPIGHATRAIAAG